MKKTVSFLLMLLISVSGVKAQFYRNFHISLGGGFDYYVGDLKDNALPHRKFMHLFGTAQLRYRINDNWVIGAGYLKGKMNGADQLGKGNPLRDFAFESKLTDYSLFARVRIANFDNKYIVTPHFVFGAAYIKFNPMRDGIPLVSLGTEGQFLGGNNPVPYKLWSIAPKAGLEATVPLLSWLDLDIYAIWATALTDHIDDVGGYYVNYNDLKEGPNGDAAVAYAYRYLNGNIPKAGQQRGNPNRRDGYVYFGVNLTIWPFGKDFGDKYKIKCPDPSKFDDPNFGKDEKEKSKGKKGKVKEEN